MKQIPVDAMTKEERIAALNEVKVLSILNHPNIIKYYENFLEQAALMIVMEYAEGTFYHVLCPLLSTAMIPEASLLHYNVPIQFLYVIKVVPISLGGTLFEFLQSSTKLLEEEEIMKYFTQLLLAIQHIHSKQILHRDLKTQNILLDKTKKVVKIVDFGISKVLTKSNAVSVSQYYHALYS